MKRLVFAVIAALAVTSAGIAHASLGKWFKNEVVPTVAGKRPLKIDPNRVKITENGKRIFDLDIGKDKLFLDLGVATVQTGALRKDLLRAGAVISGNTAVLDQVIAEQIQQKLQQALKDKAVSYLKAAPPPAADEGGPPVRRVVIYNATSEPIRYAMNARYYVVPPETGASHRATDFFLQYHAKPGDDVEIKRYSLKGDQYVLWWTEESSEITIHRIE